MEFSLKTTTSIPKRLVNIKSLAIILSRWAVKWVWLVWKILRIT